jgi:hypothetical protein
MKGWISRWSDGLASLNLYPGIRGGLVLVNVFKCLPNKAGHGHHARISPLEHLAVFALVWLKGVIQPPLQQFQRRAFSAYCSFKTDLQEDGHSEQPEEARSSVVNVMQGLT